MFLKLLEDKYYGNLDAKTVYALANNNAEFANLWLVHSIRSNCSVSELALAIAASIKWNTPALSTLESFLDISNYSYREVSTLIIDASVNSSALISDYCQKRQEKLLVKLNALKSSVNKKEVLDAAKFTANIVINNQQASDIIKSCEPLLQDVSLFGGEGKGSKNDSIRNNTHFPTPLPNDSVALALLENLIANATGLPINFAEPPVVLRYQSGQYYKWHYDHIYPHTDDIKSHIAHFGQRVKTAIFYLNDDFIGGETEFKEPFISVTPEKNKVLVFDNCDEFEKRDTTSIHRGNSIISGEKWIVTLWFRNKPFWLRSGLL